MIKFTLMRLAVILAWFVGSVLSLFVVAQMSIPQAILLVMFWMVLTVFMMAAWMQITRDTHAFLYTQVHSDRLNKLVDDPKAYHAYLRKFDSDLHWILFRSKGEGRE